MWHILRVKRVLIVGSGLTGATAAHALHTGGHKVEVFESGPVWGGQLRTETANNILYEPHGAHIFHTKDEQVWRLFNSLVTVLPYRHRVMTEVNGRLLAWPPQVSELRQLSEWRTIAEELDARPSRYRTDNFESWCLDVMGAQLYSWFVEPYTRKQWGVDPASLSASWAPKRLELRDDDYLDLFRDPYQGWPEGGYSRVVDGLLAAIPVHLGSRVTASNVGELAKGFDRVIVTAPLDDFFGDALGQLPWRGVRLESTYHPGLDHVLPCGVVNHPGLDEHYTRRIETKWMSGQTQLGTVVSKEFPGHTARHYPIDDAEGVNRRLASAYLHLLTSELGPRFLAAGRLATYTYIDMDQSMRQGLNAASAAVRPPEAGRR